MTRAEFARAIDRVRDHLLLVKNAVIEDDDIDKAEKHLADAAREIGALAEDLRSAA